MLQDWRFDVEHETPKHPDREPRGPKNWRTEFKDDCGVWAITGPPFATKLEAYGAVDETERRCFL